MDAIEIMRLLSIQLQDIYDVDNNIEHLNRQIAGLKIRKACTDLDIIEAERQNQKIDMFSQVQQSIEWLLTEYPRAHNMTLDQIALFVETEKSTLKIHGCAQGDKYAHMLSQQNELNKEITSAEHKLDIDIAAAAVMNARLTKLHANFTNSCRVSPN